MGRGRNQKLKLLYLIKIFSELTDEEHSITMPQILEELQKYEVEAQRKSIYDDLEQLDLFGIEILKEQVGPKTYYRMGSRDFEVPELKLLVDAIQSSRFITVRKSNELIKKLEKLISNYDAKQLDRQVYVSGRIKNMNESIYYGIDTIHNSINKNHKITFNYFSWNIKGEPELRHGGKLYKVSPWALVWDNENYYLVAYDEEYEQIRHYRVDKMKDIKETQEKRAGGKVFKEMDKAAYSEKRFNMYNGEVRTIKLECKNWLSNVIVDTFGHDVRMRPKDEEYFTVNIDVAVTSHFLGWLIALGKDVKIVEPDDVVIQMKQLLEDIGSLYQ